MSDDEHYGGGDSGKSTTIPVQCSALRKGQYAMLKGYPCKITEMSTSKTGKHGHAKVHLVGVDIFTGKKCEDLCPSTHKMDTPVVLKKEYQLLGADDGFLTLMDENHNIKDDVRVPTDEKILDELNQILAGDQEHLVSVLSFDKQEQITGFKVKPR